MALLPAGRLLPLSSAEPKVRCSTSFPASRSSYYLLLSSAHANSFTLVISLARLLACLLNHSISMSSAQSTAEMRLESLGYTLEQERVMGSAYTIHFARCRTSRLPVVLKQLPATSPSRASLCLREASVMEALSHRHIVALYHQVVVENQLFLVMQRALGGDLHDLITLASNGRLELSDSKRVFAQLILALEHMHQNHIVHAYVVCLIL